MFMRQTLHEWFRKYGMEHSIGLFIRYSRAFHSMYVSVRRVSRDWLVSMVILFRPNNDESDHLDDVAADEDVSAVELQWKDLTVEHFLCLFDEWYRMEPALSKKAIIKRQSRSKISDCKNNNQKGCQIQRCIGKIC
eukprot:204915_1